MNLSVRKTLHKLKTDAIGKHMIHSNKKSTFLNYAILLISVSSVLGWCELPIGNTVLWWLLDGLVLIQFFKLSQGKERIRPIFVFLLCVAVSFIYGATIQAHTYWQWKQLVGNLMVFAMPLAVYVFSEPSILSGVIRFWKRWAWLLLLSLSPFLLSDAFGAFLVPYAFLALFMPALNIRNRIVVIAAYVITITLGDSSRSDMVKFSVSLMLGCMGFIPSVRSLFTKWKKKIVYILCAMPIIFFLLGATGVFNVLNIEEELGLEGKYMMKAYGSDEEDSALADTRTFLYVGEISSAIDHNYVFYGRSMARGYDSNAFGEAANESMGLKVGDSGRGERGHCEASILNIFNFFGLIGVVIYFWIFAAASYKAVAHSKNSFVPIIGVFVAFRWLFGWVQDFSNFDLNYLFIWIMICICFSEKYRNMTDEEFTGWVRQATRR